MTDCKNSYFTLVYLSSIDLNYLMTQCKTTFDASSLVSLCMAWFHVAIEVLLGVSGVSFFSFLLLLLTSGMGNEGRRGERGV